MAASYGYIKSMVATNYATPAPPAELVTDADMDTYTVAEVKASAYLTGLVREQAKAIRGEVADRGTATWAGPGYAHCLGTMRARKFALDVLIAQGELVRDRNDRRVYRPTTIPPVDLPARGSGNKPCRRTQTTHRRPYTRPF